jgi:hypothetical protein
LKGTPAPVGLSPSDMHRHYDLDVTFSLVAWRWTFRASPSSMKRLNRPGFPGGSRV